MAPLAILVPSEDGGESDRTGGPCPKASPRTVVVGEHTPPPAAEPALRGQASGGPPPKRLGKWGWVIAAGVGALLAIPCEMILLASWGEGNHQLSDEIDRKHNVPVIRRDASRDFYAEVDREFPNLSWDERSRIAHQRMRRSADQASAAGQESLQEYGVRYRMRETKVVILGVVLLVVCFSLPLGTLIWLRRLGKVA